MIMGMPRPSCDSVSRETGVGLVLARPLLRGDALPLMFVGRVARRRRHELRSRVHLRSDRKLSRHGPSCARQLIAGQPLSPTEGVLHGSRLDCFGSPRPWWIFLAGADLLSYEQVPIGQIGRIDLTLVPLGRRPSKSESTVDARPLWLRRCRPGRRDARTSSRFPQATPATGRRELATEPGQLRNRGRTSPASPGSALIPLPTRATSSRIMAAPSRHTSGTAGNQRPWASSGRRPLYTSGRPSVRHLPTRTDLVEGADPGPAARPACRAADHRRSPSGVRLPPCQRCCSQTRRTSHVRGSTHLIASSAPKDSR